MIVISFEQARRRFHTRWETRARRAFIQQDFAEALLCANRSVRCDPECAQAWQLLGDALAALEREAEALRAYHRARKLSPNRVEPLWSISTVHANARRWRDALRYLDRAHARLKRGDGLLYEWISEDRAQALWKLGRVDDALEAVRWGLRRRPQGPRLRALRLRLQAARGRRLVPIEGGRRMAPVLSPTPGR